MGLGWETLHRANPALILLFDRAVRTNRPVPRLRCRRHRPRPRWAGCSTSTASPAAPPGAPARPAGVSLFRLLRRHRRDVRPVRARSPRRPANGSISACRRRPPPPSSTSPAASSNAMTAEPRRGTLHWSRFFRVGKCRDGYIMHCTLGDWTSLIEWVKSDGKAPTSTSPEYDQVMYRYLMAEHLFDVLDEWVKDYPRDELLERAQLLRQPYAIGAPARSAVRRRATRRARLFRRSRASGTWPHASAIRALRMSSTAPRGGLSRRHRCSASIPPKSSATISESTPEALAALAAEGGI